MNIQQDVQAVRGHARDAAKVLKTIAHEVRLRVLCQLVAGEQSVGALNREIPVSQSVLSQHLAVLRREKLVATRRKAQTVYYSLEDSKVVRIMEVLHSIYCAGGDSDQA